MFRHGWQRYLQRFGESSQGSLSLAQPGEHGPSRRIRQGGEDQVQLRVRLSHRVNCFRKLKQLPYTLSDLSARCQVRRATLGRWLIELRRCSSTSTERSSIACTSTCLPGTRCSARRGWSSQSGGSTAGSA